MSSQKIIEHLVDNGYPLQLIANQSGVKYRSIYNRINNITKSDLSDKEKNKLYKFAYAQPCMSGFEIDE